MMMDGELEEKCRNYFSGCSSVDLAIVYGSAAIDRMTPRSDIDIAVSGTFSSDSLQDIQFDLCKLFHREIDLTDMDRVKGLILHRIVTRGVVVKKNNGLLVRYLQRAIGYYEDFYPLQKKVQQARIRGFLYGY